MKKIAIIGTRDPEDWQVQRVGEIVRHLDEGTVVVSGCAHGIDAVALKCAREKGLRTVGYVPWAAYNREVQTYCTDVVLLDTVGDPLRRVAFDSIRLHPKPHALSRGLACCTPGTT